VYCSSLPEVDLGPHHLRQRRDAYALRLSALSNLEDAIEDLLLADVERAFISLRSMLVPHITGMRKSRIKRNQERRKDSLLPNNLMERVVRLSRKGVELVFHLLVDGLTKLQAPLPFRFLLLRLFQEFL
jgi:hypothetical protein